MPRRSRPLRLLITLVTAWYSLIASGQLSLAESARRSAQRASMTGTGTQEPTSPGSAVMAGMDCHGRTPADGEKHLCLCIDTGLFQLSVALPAAPVSHTGHGHTPAPGTVSDAPTVVALAPDYLLPPATAPPQA